MCTCTLWSAHETDMKELRCMLWGENRRKWKSQQSPGVEPRTPLAWATSCTQVLAQLTPWVSGNLRCLTNVWLTQHTDTHTYGGRSQCFWNYYGSYLRMDRYQYKVCSLAYWLVVHYGSYLRVDRYQYKVCSLAYWLVVHYGSYLRVVGTSTKFVP